MESNWSVNLALESVVKFLVKTNAKEWFETFTKNELVHRDFSKTSKLTFRRAAIFRINVLTSAPKQQLYSVRTNGLADFNYFLL